jgi:hypothetical protein
MSGEDSKGFWDRFDIHAKRWQTLCAGIVAIGVIVGFVGTKMGWHWPQSWVREHHDPAAVAAEPDAAVTTKIKFQSPDWAAKGDLKGLNPIFQVSSGYFNLTERPYYDVILLLQHDSRLHPIEGTLMVKNGTNPDGLKIDDSLALTRDGLNVGNYERDSNAFAQLSFTLNADDFPCGDTTMTLRTWMWIRDDPNFPDTASDEAVAVYHKSCSPLPGTGSAPTT